MKDWKRAAVGSAVLVLIAAIWWMISPVTAFLLIPGTAFTYLAVGGVHGGSNFGTAFKVASVFWNFAIYWVLLWAIFKGVSALRNKAANKH